MPLIIEERHSKACRQLLRTDPIQIVFCFTRTEILSAIWRRRREGLLDDADVKVAEARLDKLAASARPRRHDAKAINLRIGEAINNCDPRLIARPLGGRRPEAAYTFATACSCG